MDKPLFAMPQPMQFDDPLVQEHCQREIEEPGSSSGSRPARPSTGTSW